MKIFTNMNYFNELNNIESSFFDRVSELKTKKELKQLLQELFPAKTPDQHIRTFKKYPTNFIPGGVILDEDKFFLLINGYMLKGNKIFTKFEISLLREQKVNSFRENGWVEYDKEFFNKKESYIWIDNKIFVGQPSIFAFLIDSGVEEFAITEEFIENIEEAFHFKTKGKRALIATLERQEFLRKIDSDYFVKRKPNEMEIYKLMTFEIDKMKFNFLDKKHLNIALDNVISQFSLIGDEWYYILKEYGTKKYNFSSGNSMGISKKRFEYTKMSKRVKDIIKIPAIMSHDELSYKVGAGEFSTINHAFFYDIKDGILYFDKNDKEHIKIMRDVFDPLIGKYKNIVLTTPIIKSYLELQKTTFKKNLSLIYSYSTIFKAIYDGEYTRTSEGEYIFGNTSKVYIDSDDWSGL